MKPYLIVLVFGLVASQGFYDFQFNNNNNYNNNNYDLFNQPAGYYDNGLFPNFVTRDSTKRAEKLDCTDKQDEGHYEHPDCKKYWQCLYVGTIFQNSLERKCPIGTMFHPVQHSCEISTSVICI